MPAPEDVFALLPLVRAGDADAQAEFYKCFEPFVRRAVRVRLRVDDRLRRVLDSMDVCQEVMKSFLMRAAGGEYDVQELRQLLALLQQMSANKLSKQRRRYAANRRDLARQRSLGDDPTQLTDRAPSILGLLADQELLTEMLQRLKDDERQIAERRANGEAWQDIANHLGAQPDALRMKLARAVERVMRELDPEE